MLPNSEEKKKRGILNWVNPLTSQAGPMGKTLRLVFLIILLFAITAPFVCWYEYNRTFRDYFDPVEEAKLAIPGELPKGAVYTQALITIAGHMTESWLPNDLIYPSIFLDNPQNYQLGQLETLRYCTRVLRDRLSRQRTTDKIDIHADRAFTDFSNNPHLWIFPSAESKFLDGIKSLKAYQKGLLDGSSHFYPRADSLIDLLDQLVSLLGGVNTRLANAPRDWTRRLSEETAGDPLTQGETTQDVKVPWRKIDDNFYFARGVSYTMREVLIAVRWEFDEILKLKRADELMDNIIDGLALANFEPLFVLNGSRDSVFANHSLSLMATLESMRQKLINMQQMLER